MIRKKKKIVVAGHICLDITPIFLSNKVGKIEEVLAPGKLINVEQADIHTGGAVANTGLGMKILGADVKLMGKIGKDSFGELVLKILEEYDVSEGMISSLDVSTSYSVVIAVPGVDRIFLHNPGANDTFRSEDIKDEMLADISMFHFGYPTLMKNMYQDEGEELFKLFRRMKELNITTSLDMSSIDEASEAGKVNWNKILQKVLPYVDFFVPSIEELGFMLDREKYQEWLIKADGGDITSNLSINDDVKPLADMLMDMGAKVILIKCGAPGIYYRTADKNKLNVIGSNLDIDLECWASREGFEESYKPERVASGTGAGDTSIAAFLTAVLNGGYTLEQCLQFAVATGASCVSEYDALSGLKTFAELEEKINGGWKKQHLL